MKKEELAALADRLDAGDDPASVARELRRLAQRRRGRQPEADREAKQSKRALLANALFDGTFPKRLCPKDLRLELRTAKGSRTNSDDLAGRLLGGASSSVVARARAEDAQIEAMVRWLRAAVRR